VTHDPNRTDCCLSRFRYRTAIAAANGFAPNARLATALLVGSSYLYGALANLWATRGRHPGWVLYAAALVLIVYGANKSGG
jgi:hypothetical protein